MQSAAYIGRFAPSPTGPLHAGSLVAALASWLDARAHGGRWLVRIEDVDTPRCVPGADALILDQLQRLGLHPDGPVVWQSRRTPHYEAALRSLMDRGLVYPCTCSRRMIEDALERQGVPRERHTGAVYPGTCRPASGGHRPQAGACPPAPDPEADSSGPVAWRLNLSAHPAPSPLRWIDRRLGPQSQDLRRDVGDFVVRRADGLWAYQLAVVVDDALQGITHVVRGADLVDNTPRQLQLMDLLGHPRPVHLHTPLVLAEDGQKLSKQTGAAALDLADAAGVRRELASAARVLDLPPPNDAASTPEWLNGWVGAWGRRWAATP